MHVCAHILARSTDMEGSQLPRRERSRSSHRIAAFRSTPQSTCQLHRKVQADSRVLHDDLQLLAQSEVGQGRHEPTAKLSVPPTFFQCFRCLSNCRNLSWDKWITCPVCGKGPDAILRVGMSSARKLEAESQHREQEKAQCSSSSAATLALPR
jgi:hypothetical protein